MISINSLSDKWRAHAGTIVRLYDTEFVRLVGLGSDDEDFYYITDHIHNGAIRRTWNSAAGHLKSLKGTISEEFYTRLDHRFLSLGSQPEPFQVIFEMGPPISAWINDRPHCFRCHKPWTALDLPNLDALDEVGRDFSPACHCHHACPHCNGPRQMMGANVIHPERSGFMCPVCDAKNTA